MKPLFFIMIFALAGCSSLAEPRSSLPAGVSPLVLWGAGETVSLLHSDRLLEDHVVSFLTKKDCSFPRVWRGEGNYCMSEEEIKEANKPAYSLQKIYCYKTIAQVSCYTQPSPYPSDILQGIYYRPIYPQQTD